MSDLVERAVQRLRDNIARRESTEDVEALKAVLIEMSTQKERADKLERDVAQALKNCEYWMGVATELRLSKNAQPEEREAEGEREALRAAQAKAVMPLIGNLLDQWESVPNDLKDHIREIQEGFEQAMDEIEDAMEGRCTPQKD